MKCHCGCGQDVPPSAGGPLRKYATRACRGRVFRRNERASIRANPLTSARRTSESDQKRARAFELFADPDNENWQIAQRLGVHDTTISVWRAEFEGRKKR